jgi:2-hydroxy-3-oxopropionate reductase
MKQATIAFIGLGIMGRPMAAHLARAGYRLVAHTLEGVPQELLAMGVSERPSAMDAAREADIVILMLPDTPDVEAVLFGPLGVAEGAHRGTLVIDMSTISPVATQAFAQRLAVHGLRLMDAPVSGGEVGAKAASLTIMVGGSETDFAIAKPLFEKMGKNITLVGEVGAGQITKAANQMIVALNIATVAEALSLAARMGADPARVRQALMGGFASSRVLEVHGERMIKGTFEPGFRIRLHRKDLRIIAASAEAVNQAAPLTAVCQQLMNACAAMGAEDLDHAALIKVYGALGAQAPEQGAAPQRMAA